MTVRPKIRPKTNVKSARGKKNLQKDSAYEEYDIDGDGVVSDKELAAKKAIQEAETQEEKAGCIETYQRGRGCGQGLYRERNRPDYRD